MTSHDATAPPVPQELPPCGSPARVRVDLDAIAGNVRSLQRHAGNAQVMAVVKADAYGHGLVPAARAALRGGATWLGVAQVAEALLLRDAGIEVPVLSWLHAPGMDFRAAVQAGVDLGAPAPWALDAITDAARATGATARVQLKADTGLGRGGAYGADWEVLVEHARRLEAEGVLRVTGLFTHFAYADAPQHPTVVHQQEVFADAVRLAERHGCRPEVRHMSNSAATLTTPSAAWDMVRPGLSVYGLSPVPDLGDPAAYGLVPAMTVSADVHVVKRVPAGQGVSYGHTYVTERETTLADIPVGYADGIPRHASNAAPVSIDGTRHRIAGRVCMDQFVVDVGDQPVQAGDEVVLFGPGTGGEPTAEDWAQAAGTISYEIVSRIGTRVPRVYVGTGA